MHKNKLLIFSSIFVVGLILCLNSLAGDIVILGDSQLNEAAQRKVVQAILPFKPSVIFRVGDIVMDGNDEQQWKMFRDINDPLLKSAENFPVLGNHDKASALYFQNFPLIHNKHWYSVERENIHFIVLDSNVDLGLGSEQFRWLESDLKNVKSSVKFKIALFHHPMFGVGQGHNEDEKKLKPVLLGLFEKYGVSLVFSGHEHNYQRFRYSGIYFIVTGGGGAQLRDKIRESAYLQKFKKANHFCLLIPENDSLRVKVIDADARVIDDFIIHNPR